MGEIIDAAARPQPLDPVVDLAERREDERRRLDPLAAQRTDNAEPVELRQHAVNDQHVVLAFERLREPLLAVAGELGNVANLAERLHEVVGGITIVFDNQQTHSASILTSRHRA